MLDFESLTERARSRWIYWTVALGIGAILSPLLLPVASDLVALVRERAPVAVAPAPLPVQKTPPMPPPFAGTDSTVQSTAQRLQLVSVTLGASPTSGQAQIGTARQYPQTYAVGSILANGAVLTEIHYDHVVLRRGNERMELRLGAATSSGALDTIPAAPQRAAAATANNTAEALPDSGIAAAPTFEQSVQVQPVYEGVVLKGLEVAAGLPPADPSAYGLVRGDVITAIGDVPVADPADAWQQLAIAAATRGTVTVRRAGETRTVRLAAAQGEAP